MSVAPNVGFSRGGTRVKVDASQVPPSGDIWCVFDNIRAGVRRLTNQIGCKSSPFPPEQVKLAVEGEGIVGLSLSFTFLPDFEVESVFPTRGSSAGGTKVNLTLSGVVDASIQEKVMCQFGDTYVQARMIKKNKVTCISPLGSHNEGAVLAIAVDGDDVAVISVRFQYFTSRELLSIEPRVGSLDGNPTMLAVLKNIEVGFGIAYDCRFEVTGSDPIVSTAQLSFSGDSLSEYPLS
ncbi:hypothetical protein P3T76_015166 [Phytophthora citrophthora]|uniref:IPT/TIG domain-containing protein n=1 Tax=Phytophthora citrophthora TaxID=4793 RepID=A0AAD9G049_9STRA|nr:hypothetical protein P3T76_015546 [Phytophthora citrophthora]KAK1929366.1 hypothetical protein P3T76_015118 [Phytophthora citrophthora]KAK1929414.1 hypothetical protein P3T76_015166 [Phytophthora citrophthora]